MILNQLGVSDERTLRGSESTLFLLGIFWLFCTKKNPDYGIFSWKKNWNAVDLFCIVATGNICVFFRHYLLL